jgi:D-sedoheptulose 7-phosphate isomerase
LASPATNPAPSRLEAGVSAREETVRKFFERESARLARACHEMARSFSRGGRLIPFGTGTAATDAAHAAVEFMHPVIVGKRALPAISPASDPTGTSTLPRLARGDDIALAIAHGKPDAATTAFIAEARRRGMLTIAMTPEGDLSPDADHSFAVPSDDPTIVQETQETAYHVLWELVHVFFEHPGLLDEACITCGDVAVQAEVVAIRGSTATIEKDGAREQVAIDLVEEVRLGDQLLCHAGVALERVPGEGNGSTAHPAVPANATDDPASFLYPFLEREEVDLDSVLKDVEGSTRRKAEDVIDLRSRIDLAAVTECAGSIHTRLGRGGTLFTFGNGGSSTDAQDLAADALERDWPAACLNNDVATVTAVGNDVGFDKAFSRQLIPLGGANDIAVAISTSGNSDNLIAGLDEARRRQMLTVGIAGYEGGRMAELGWLDHLFVVPSDYIPRIQEAQATIYHLLLDAIGNRP